MDLPGGSVRMQKLMLWMLRDIEVAEQSDTSWLKIFVSAQRPEILLISSSHGGDISHVTPCSTAIPPYCHTNQPPMQARLSKIELKNHDFLVSSSCWSFCDNYLLIFPDLMITLELLMRFPSGMEKCWSALFFYLSENYPAPISLTELD